MKLEDYIKEVIKCEGYTVKSFAAHVNIPYSTLRDILARDLKKTSIENYVSICKGLHIHPESLLAEFKKPDTENMYLRDLPVLREEKRKADEVVYKRRIHDVFAQHDLFFDIDYFDFDNFYAEAMTVTDRISGREYSVDPLELYSDMRQVFKKINSEKFLSALLIEDREIKNALDKLDMNRDTFSTVVSELTPVDVTESAAAGIGYVYGDNGVTTYYTDRTNLPAYDFATIISGDSMEPVLHNGDIALIKQGYDNVNGDIYVVDYAGKSYIKRLHNDGDRFRLISINREYETIIIEVPPTDDVYFNIVGKVVDSFTPVNPNEV